jgi:hypothetical protein
MAARCKVIMTGQEEPGRLDRTTTLKYLGGITWKKN